MTGKLSEGQKEMYHLLRENYASTSKGFFETFFFLGSRRYWPVEREEPVQAKKREKDDGGTNGLPKVRGLVGVGGTEFGHQDAEYVHEEAGVRQDAQQP